MSGRLCIAIPHIERPQNYLFRTVRSLIRNDAFGDTVIAICDFSAEPSANMSEVAQGLAPFVESGQLILDRFSGERPSTDGLIRNFGDDEQRVKWRSRQVLDVAYTMERYAGFAPYYLHLEDDVVAERGCIEAVRKMIGKAPASWFSYKLLEMGACAILFQSADLAQLAAYLRLMYYEMPVDWLIEEHIRFKERTGRKSFVTKGLFDHIGTHSTLTGQTR